MIIGPYTVSRGTLVPYEEESSTRQSRFEAADGAVDVADDFDYELKKCKIIVPRAEAMNIKGFLRYASRYSAVPFQITDDFGTSFLVRLWDRKISMVSQTGNRVEMNMIFRVEVA